MKQIQLLFFLFSLALSSCVHTPSTTTSEEMLPDGKTWYVTITASCSEFKRMDSDECAQKYDLVMEAHSTELCGAKPERTFKCSIKQVSGQYPRYSCYAKCK